MRSLQVKGSAPAATNPSQSANNTRPTSTTARTPAIAARAETNNGTRIAPTAMAPAVMALCLMISSATVDNAACAAFARVSSPPWPLFMIR